MAHDELATTRTERIDHSGKLVIFSASRGRGEAKSGSEETDGGEPKERTGLTQNKSYSV